jgi:hypothetical protein
MGIGDVLGRIGKVINHNINDIIEIIAETRKGFNQKAVLYNSSGDDSPPIKNDKIVLVKVDGTGKYIVIGTVTPSQGAKPGEKIFFSRSESGDIKSKLSMLGDGLVTWEAEKNFRLKTKESINLEAEEKATIKGADVELTGKVKAIGGSFECAGQVAPTGEGALCGCKFCFVTAAPVAGSKAEGT